MSDADSTRYMSVMEAPTHCLAVNMQKTLFFSFVYQNIFQDTFLYQCKDKTLGGGGVFLADV